MKDACPKCGGLMIKKALTAEFSKGEKLAHIPVTYWECESCREQHFDIEALKLILGTEEDENEFENKNNSQKPN